MRILTIAPQFAFWRKARRSDRGDRMPVVAPDATAIITTNPPQDIESAMNDVRKALELGRAEFMNGAKAAGCQRIEQATRDFPSVSAGFADLIELFQACGRLREAEAVATTALPRFPADYWLWFWAAHLAERRREHAKAFERWAQIAKLSHSDEPLRGLIRAAARLQRFDLLEAVLAGNFGDLPVAPVGDLEFRAPHDLAATPTVFRRGLVIGSCLTAALPAIFALTEPFCETDHILFNNAAVLPPSPPRSVAEYDFQIIQIPLHALLPAGAVFHLGYDKSEDAVAVYEQACDRLARILHEMLRWNLKDGLTAFVTNFLVPQQNPVGRLLPRNDLRNGAHLIERLNDFLIEQLEKYRNVHLLDVDQIAATMGKRYVQDDMVWTFSHGAVLSNWDHAQDQARLEPLRPVSEYYPNRVDLFCEMIWKEVEAMWRSIRQIDVVKMVLIDLDDTLWRGVLAEAGHTAIDGWPLGLAEALHYLRRRGILLGIVSKNSEQRILELWPQAFGDLLPLDMFALKRINWSPKAENISSLLQEANLLSKSVVFIDDNPVERAAITASFPDMRVIGANPYLLRRILLWSAETQVPVITAESSARGDMIRAQGERERDRKILTREEFLSSLNVRVTISELTASSNPRFARAFELINKTNQFNTTGRRWSSGDAEAHFRNGGSFFTVEVIDKFTSYGLVAVLCVIGDQIQQFVMSCRVVGLDVEFAIVSQLLAITKSRGIPAVEASLVDTDANLLSRDIWANTGFVPVSGRLLHSLRELPPLPAHIQIAQAAEPPLKAVS